VSPQLRGWRDALFWSLIEDLEAIDEKYDAASGWEGRLDVWERYHAEQVARGRLFEAELTRLSGAELIAAREAELEHERIERLVALLRETDPDQVEARARAPPGNATCASTSSPAIAPTVRGSTDD
jgi:hypothetical protein